MSRTDRFVEGQGWLEPVGDWIQGVVGGTYSALGRPGRLLKDLAHGTRLLGHPLHPAITDVPLGAWTVAVAAYLVHRVIPAVPAAAGDFALLAGLVAALGAALTGYTDHHETFGLERRYATLHGLLMTAASLAAAASLLVRWQGGASAHGLAVGLAVLTLVVALIGAYLGGHLTFGMGTMVNHGAFEHGPEDFVDVAASADVADNALRRFDAGGVGVLVVRLGGRLHAIGATCSHAGGPLGEGTMLDGVVTCPWHGSEFSVRDGSVRHGPATFAQARYEVREREGRIEVRAAG